MTARLAAATSFQGISASDAARLAEEFGRDLLQRHKSDATARIYLWSISSLVEFARADEVIINVETIQRWQDERRQELNPRSFALVGTGFREFIKWLSDNRHLDADLEREFLNAVRPVKYDKLKLPSTLTPSALMRLEFHLQTQPDNRPATVRELRDRALFFYVKATMARVSEILQVRRDNFERTIVRQRGGGEKSLTAPPGVARLIREYLRARTDDLPWLWIAFRTDGSVGPLQDAGVLKIWERLSRRIGVEPFTTRQLRNTAATLLVQRGHDSADIMELLGARDIRQIQAFKQVVNERLQRVQADLDVAY